MSDFFHTVERNLFYSTTYFIRPGGKVSIKYRVRFLKSVLPLFSGNYSDFALIFVYVNSTSLYKRKANIDKYKCLKIFFLKQIKIEIHLKNQTISL